MVNRNLDHRILLARIDTISRQRPTAILSNIVLMTLCVGVFWRSEPRTQLGLWWMANFVISTLRLAEWRWRRSKPEMDLTSARKWLWVVTIYIALAGLTWGIGAWVFLSAENTGVLVFFLLTLIAVTNGGAISYAAHYPAIVAFATPITLLAAYKLFLIDAEYTTILGFSTLAFLAFTLAIGRNYSAAVGAAITLAVENTELLAEAERQKLNAELANQDKSRFFAAVSHDLRQPLYAMGLLLESLGERLATSEQKTLHGNIERTHHAMVDMFGSLLEISQLDAAAVQINRQPIFLDRIVQTLIEEFAPSAAQKKLKLEFTPTGVWVESDPILLSRILRNLLSNAIKFTDAGSVNVKSARLGDHVQLSVVDTGKGIPACDHETVFSEYFQLHNPDRDRAKGLGLGLAVVQRLSVLLEIPLKLNSIVASGSEFSLDLPVIAPPVQSVNDVDRHHDVSGLHVVVVDDDPDVLAAMGLLLTDHGCVVTCVSTSHEAIEAITQIDRPPDIVLSDFRLRGGANGIDAIATLRAAVDPELPALIITGDTDPTTREAALAAGLSVFYKPISPDQLISAIAELA